MPRKKLRKSSRALRIAIIGGGKVGSVLGRILSEEGQRVICVVSRTRSSAQRAGRFIGCRNTTTSLSNLPHDTELIYITTPHDAVEGVARSLSLLDTLDFPRLSVCHASGMLTADVLQPLALKGATVFSFHPLQTFPRDFAPRAIVPTARGITYGVDGPPGGVRMARRLARILGGTIVEIPPEMRTFYHAACVVASNHLTALLSVLDRMYRTMTGGADDFYRVFQPILMATLQNIQRSSPAKALSGPVARGGVATVRAHLAMIRRMAPELIPPFVALSLETVKLALDKGSISTEKAKELTDLISSYTTNVATDLEKR